MTQAPDPNNSSLSCIAQGTEGDLVDCGIDAMFAAGPSPELVGFVLVGSLLTSLFIAGDGDVVVPAVVMVLLGSVAVPTLPPEYTTYAYTVVVLGATVAMLAAYVRFTHQSGF